MDMSVNPDSMASTDYSDFEYQQVHLQVSLAEQADSTGSGDIQAKTVTQIEPLGGIGGLDNNEVAELVYMETEASIRFFDEGADQDVATSGSLKGAVGANLSNSRDAFPGIRDASGTTTIISTTDIDESNVNIDANGGSEDRWFQLYNASGHPPFDDQTNGPGGGAGNHNFYAAKNFRDLVGRGPVLDSSDDISISLNGEVGDTIISTNFIVRVHMVWDVAETSDAGRAFSVPN